MVEIQSMVPIAAVVDLVLGIATLSIIGRSQGQPSTNRVIGCILGWILIFLGLSYLMTAVLEFRYGAQAEFSSLDLTKVSGTFAYTAKNLLLSSAVVLMALLPFFFPFRVVQKEWDVWFLIVFSCSAAALFTSLHLLTDFRHFNIEFFLHIPGYMVLIAMYLRFIATEVRDDDRRLRKISMVAGLLLIGIHGETMTYWLSQVLSMNDYFFQRQSIEASMNASYASWGGVNMRLTLGASAILILCAGEAWRSSKLGFLLLACSPSSFSSSDSSRAWPITLFLTSCAAATRQPARISPLRIQYGTTLPLRRWSIFTHQSSSCSSSFITTSLTPSVKKTAG